MKELFGISMTTIASIMVVLLAICLLTLLYIFVRKPIVFRIGLRNIPRRPAQTVLIIIGLMLSTLIVASALGVGDTLDTSVRQSAYDQLNTVDQTIVTSASGSTDQYRGTYFAQSKADDVRSRLAAVDAIDGLLPSIFSQVAAVNEAKELANSQVLITGVEAADLDSFGGYRTTGGDKVDFASYPKGTVVVSKDLAKDLDLTKGDQFTIYVNGQPATLTAGDIVKNNVLVGLTNNPDGSINESGLAMPLADAQTLLGRDGQINQILVSQTGSIKKSKSEIDDVRDEVAPLLAGTGLGINDSKAQYINAAEGISSGFTAIFIVLGLFSIAAGILLIVLIFTMLAAERRSEMGMARAVGQRRLQLIQQFISEGAGYALLSGLVGLAVGVGVTYILAAILGSLIGDAFPIKGNVSPRSLISAYALGVVITFITVVGASWKVSRLNIVAAVRDIPDVTPHHRRKRTLAWAILLTLAGAGLLLGAAGSGKAFPFYCGLSLLPFGIALVLVWFGIPGRVAFSLVGLWLLAVWLLPDSAFTKIFGKYDGGIEMFFLSGIFLVIGTTVLIVQNTTTLLWLVTQIGSLFKSQLGAIKLAVAYPGQARGRTGMAIAMFSLIIFSLVMIATISENLTAAFLNDDALAGWDVTAQTNPGQPVADLQSRIANANLDQSDIQTVGKVQSSNGGAVSMQQTGPVAGPPGSYLLNEMDGTFLDTTNWKFSNRASGYDSDQAVIEALRSDSTLVVVDGFAAFGNDFGPPSALELKGIETGKKTFAPITITVANADGQGSTNLTIIGVIDQSRQYLSGMFGTGPTLDAIVGSNPSETYFIKTRSGADTEQIASAIQGQVIKDGVKVTSIQKSLEDAQRVTSGFLYMIQGFMGLGLIVGLAAVGVISFRSVVERRQQIGMMRALGFQKKMVSNIFLIETAYIVVLGILAGTATGLALARNLLTSDDNGDLNVHFSVPVPLIAIILVGTVIVALLMAYVPSRQASNIAPADALRYE